jgi:1-acyl-sn-glycerol-3-phosphate acyltransferase
MYALMELSGQEYVDVYAAKVKEDLDKANLPPDAVDKVMPRRAADVETGRVPETRAG